jgi:hypothetical protein
MKRGYATLAIVGAVAAIAVFALTQGPVASGIMNLQEIDGQFTKYLAKNGKSYKQKAEYSLRKALYEASLERIEKHNSKGHSWFKAINQFSDMTATEIEQMFGGGIEGEERPEIEALHQHSAVKAGSPVDWRSTMNPIKD